MYIYINVCVCVCMCVCDYFLIEVISYICGSF